MMLLGGVIFTACEKADDPIESQIDSKIETITKFQEVSNQFVEVELRSLDNFDRKPGWWKKLLKVVGADLTGGLGGALIGSAVPGLGTGVGAIIGGAGASMTAGSTLSAPPGGGGGANIDNVYDYVGEEHVNILLNGLTVDYEANFDGTELKNANYLEYARNWLVENEVFSMEEVEGYEEAYLVENLNQALEHDGKEMVLVIESFYELELLTADEYDILSAYYTAFEASTSFDSFKEYSIEAEAVITDSDFETEQKALFLSMMSTTRHDLNYWKDLEE